MDKWFIKLGFKGKLPNLIIYEDGLVYDKEKNQKLGYLKSDAINKIKNMINPNVYMFKKLGYYYNENCNNIVLTINGNNRNNKNIKLVGWYHSKHIIDLIVNKTNWEEMFN